jgi:hypothetical protein
VNVLMAYRVASAQLIITELLLSMHELFGCISTSGPLCKKLSKSSKPMCI